MYLNCIDRLVKTLGNDFPATALVWVWISCTHSCLDCLSRHVRIVYKHEWRKAVANIALEVETDKKFFIPFPINNSTYPSESLL